ncbi:hypothetical protein ZIOFF_043883 [Zingiber officinale]|uniref:CCDC93 coiled-coil domain-containing protein n=1 Tax=Zingiber officinale TaxID=94328 RepID=A0A8J5FW56_ZINOF|nr:hypothetical protein ZIOFF_043883 [Zingiber officinale]
MSDVAHNIALVARLIVIFEGRVSDGGDEEDEEGWQLGVRSPELPVLGEDESTLKMPSRDGMRLSPKLHGLPWPRRDRRSATLAAANRGPFSSDASKPENLKGSPFLPRRCSLKIVELAAKLRMILSVKRKIDDVPTQAELIQEIEISVVELGDQSAQQSEVISLDIAGGIRKIMFQMREKKDLLKMYERRLSELYSQIRDKHKQTSTLFDTYNSLLEIKELMLKETSILNSINSQFQDALTSTIGRTKLVDSLETIVKGARQKLEKVELSLMAEKKNSESLREKLTTNLADQRYFSSLLKELQVSSKFNN